MLADAHLVAGDVRPDDARFAFGCGTFLQLLDDLRDVAADLEAGHQTIFTRAARRGPLPPRLRSRPGLTGPVPGVVHGPGEPAGRSQGGPPLPRAKHPPPGWLRAGARLPRLGQPAGAVPHVGGGACRRAAAGW